MAAREDWLRLPCPAVRPRRECLVSARSRSKLLQLRLVAVAPLAALPWPSLQRGSCPEPLALLLPLCVRVEQPTTECTSSSTLHTSIMASPSFQGQQTPSIASRPSATLWLSRTSLPPSSSLPRHAQPSRHPPVHVPPFSSCQRVCMCSQYRVAFCKSEIQVHSCSCDLHSEP